MPSSPAGPGFGDSLIPPEANAPVAPSSALGASIGPDLWPWLAGALAVIVALIAARILGRRRQPKVPRLAAPAKRPAADESEQAAAIPLRLDCQLDITGAARSVMMFSIDYRLEVANRADRAVRDLAITIRLDQPRQNSTDAPLADTAEERQTIPRIGPQQSRSITGTLRLPLAAIAPLRQGPAPLLIPLLHATLESPDRETEQRTFVVGTPSPATMGRLQPIRLDVAPGGIAGLKVLPVNAP